MGEEKILQPIFSPSNYAWNEIFAAYQLVHILKIAISGASYCIVSNSRMQCSHKQARLRAHYPASRALQIRRRLTVSVRLHSTLPDPSRQVPLVFLSQLMLLCFCVQAVLCMYYVCPICSYLLSLPRRCRLMLASVSFLPVQLYTVANVFIHYTQFHFISVNCQIFHVLA